MNAERRPDGVSEAALKVLADSPQSRTQPEVSHVAVRRVGEDVHVEVAGGTAILTAVNAHRLAEALVVAAGIPTARVLRRHADADESLRGRDV